MYNSNGYQQQQSGYQHGGQQDNRHGLANEYYSQGQQHGGNHNQPPPQYQQYGPQYGQQQPQHGGYNPPPPSGSPYGQRDNQDHGYGANQDYGNQSYGSKGNPNDSQESSRGVMGAVAGAAVGGLGAYKLAGPATGHKKTSGLVGALGGALTGHVLQDGVSHWKDSHDDKKKKEDEEKKHKKDDKHHQGGHHDRPREGHFAGGFTGSSQDIRLDTHGEFNLHAQCRRMDGSFQWSTLSLNRILENDNGSFRWSTGQSSGGSSDITVQPGDTLRAVAARHNCSFDELARHNGIQNADMIYPGQRLEVPGGGRNSGNGGNFGASARNVRLVDGGQTLEAELLRNGEWVTSSIVLDERIGNKDGCLEFV
ncbi:CNVH-domain-containing protein [Bimuria novae-zelandiae CBS 107.79]|uniref:CNVH-domain-containing protein n=1 Tax=Bimuria novae-zelandiae CBS 107.79 TaxID=1447943 RepID=A0A6A5ULW4_9PLEO|nr:CNVH-domain-containing protein [Bimuria novae-zelandiae CBS 107.79]